MTRRSTQAGTTPVYKVAVFKVASVLLGYPDTAVHAARPDLAAAVEHLPDGAAQHGLARFLGWLADTDPTVAAAHYVEVFDLRRRCCLYLTYYAHGDTRKRGMALLALKDRYRRGGLHLDTVELPDYLPIVLEFAAIAPAHGDAALIEHRRGLELLRAGLADAHSPYAGVIDAVAAMLPGPTRADLDAVRQLIKDGPPHEDVGLEPFAPPEFLAGADLPTGPTRPPGSTGPGNSGGPQGGRPHDSRPRDHGGP